MRTNIDKLIECAVQGSIKHPYLTAGFSVHRDGHSVWIPSVGGIVYNVKVGDSAYGWSADHIEPGVSIKNKDEDENNNLIAYASIGNKARVITGDAKGAEGFVLGTHGGVNHVLVQFREADLRKMAIDDNILVEARGLGFALPDYGDISVYSIDPAVFLSLPIEEKDGKLHIPVAGVIPSHLIGSGVGDLNTRGHDCDLMAAEWDEIAALKLDRLKFGDIVYIQDFDSTFGRQYKKGAFSIGVILHGDSILSGHGPGITTFLSSKRTIAQPILDGDANILHYVDFAYEVA